MGKWGPLPPQPYNDPAEEEAQGAFLELLTLIYEAPYHLRGKLRVGSAKEQWDWDYRDCRPWRRGDFERALARFHEKIDESFLVRREGALLRDLAGTIDELKGRKRVSEEVPPSLRTVTAVGECFRNLWEHGENWLTRKEFFNAVCAKLEEHKCPPITCRHFARLLEEMRLDQYFPPMRRTRKRRKRPNGSVDS